MDDMAVIGTTVEDVTVGGWQREAKRMLRTLIIEVEEHENTVA